MKANRYPILGVILSLGLASAACGFSIQWSSPTPTAPPPTETTTSTPLPTATATATPVSQAFFCVGNSIPTALPPQCTLPSGDERSEFCTGQSPYTLIAIPTEDTYEVLTPGIYCSDAGTKNGKQLLTCTGPQSYSFAFQICNAACIVPTATAVPAPAGVCPAGYNYVAGSNCCTAVALPENGCITQKFNLTACGPVNCYKIKDMGVCNATPRCKWVPGSGDTKSACLNK